VDLASDAVSLQLVEEKVVADLVEGLQKVHDKDVDLFALLDCLGCTLNITKYNQVTV
jgi:hypothetical protein